MSARSSTAAVLGVVVALAGCGATGSGGTSASGPGSIVVQVVYQPGGDLYVEGAVTEVRLRDSSGTVVATKRGDGPLRFEHLAMGSYTLEPALRPCSANCGMLDERTDTCSEVVDVGRDARQVQVTFDTGSPCRITVTPTNRGEGAADCARQVRLGRVIYTSNGHTDRRPTRFATADEADCHDVGPDAAGSVFAEDPPQVAVWKFSGYSPDEVVGVRFDKDTWAVFVADSVPAPDQERIYRELRHAPSM